MIFPSHDSSLVTSSTLTDSSPKTSPSRDSSSGSAPEILAPSREEGKSWVVKIVRRNDKAKMGEIVVPVGEKMVVGRKEFGEVKFISRQLWEITGKEDCLQIHVVSFFFFFFFFDISFFIISFPHLLF